MLLDNHNDLTSIKATTVRTVVVAHPRAMFHSQISLFFFRHRTQSGTSEDCAAHDRLSSSIEHCCLTQ